MPSSGISPIDELLGGGYPEKSTVLLVGPPGVGKEALGYWFTQSGLGQNGFSLYVTRLSVHEVLNDAKAFGVELAQNPPFWLSSGGGQARLDINDLASISFNIKEILRKNTDREIRIVVDVISSLLMLNSPEVVYKFLTQLLTEVKGYNAVLLATLEEGMHRPEVLTSMQQLFDGFIEMSFYRAGLNVVPLLRVGKMRGVAPQPDYFRFQFSRGGLSLGRITAEQSTPLPGPATGGGSTSYLNPGKAWRYEKKVVEPGVESHG